ncbi:MAG: hypothetical protein Q7R98_02490 [Candidatus Jorgensenbacteria bacterium]|nr:hypothetical protein [Candidatus Jorgensenbacteria bacterium]
MLKVSMAVSVLGSLVAGIILANTASITQNWIFLVGGIALALGFAILFAKLIDRADARVREFFAKIGISDQPETRGKKNWKIRNALQPNVDAMLKIIATELDTIFTEEEEKKKRYSTQSCDVPAIEKVRDLLSLAKKISETKETFWKLCETARKLGFAVEKSHRDYLSASHMA